MEQALDTLSAKELVAHYAARTDGKQPPKGLSKAALIAKINALPALPPSAVEPTAPAAAPVDAEFTVAAWAKANGKDGREVRKALRAAGLRAPYTLAQVQALGA